MFLNFKEKINNIFSKNIDKNEIINEVEELLILSDVSYNITEIICNNIKNKLKNKEDSIKLVKEEILNILEKNNNEIKDNKIILVVGVNGVGKTTTISKIANMYIKQNKKVLVVAGDTFRAGAVEQLDYLAKYNNIDIFKNDSKDAASVVYDAIKLKDNYDYIICDTAGRLHNKKNLMLELEKIKNVISKDNDITTYIVLDATTGQNGLIQTKSFNELINIDGIILTKLDSTSKGGNIINISYELNIPIVYTCFGENINDISKFDSREFINNII
ncbi:MAG: signal recognition particle-docking protein FtsY [Clostridia bacterium]